MVWSRGYYLIFLFAVTSVCDGHDGDGYLEEVMIKTTYGMINASLEQWHGLSTDGTFKTQIVAFKVPYAAPPIGELRFQKPQKPKSWDDDTPLDANRANRAQKLHMCPQHQVLPDMDDMMGSEKEFWWEFSGGERVGVGAANESIMAMDYSEDCLYLNVWAPTKNGAIFTGSEKKPVMVFIHGGGFFAGSAYTNLYEATLLSMTTDTVFVTMNYRLGALGFLSYDGGNPDRESGNMGLMDQQMALEWVRDNIESFGGDPNSVTLFGESAGSASTQYHLMNKDSSKLFHRAILHSGVVTSHWAYNEPKMVRDASLELAVRVNCAEVATEQVNKDVLACMKKVKVEDILGPKVASVSTPFRPTTDDTFFPHSMEDGMKNLVEQDQSSRKPILMGFNRNEGSFLVLLSQKFKAGSYDVGTFIGTPTFDSLVQWWSKEAKEDATVMEKIRDKYYNRELSGLIDFFGEEGFNCEVTETSDKLKDNGHQVDTYRFDMFYDFAQNVFEYLGASHMFELHALFLRPFHNLGMYTPLERTVSVNMVKNWGAFAHGVSSFPSTSEEEAFVIAKKETTTWEKMKIDTKRCHFLHCIPSIFEHSKTGMMSDTSCMEYLMSGAGKIEISILTVFAMVAVFLNTFTS